MKKLKCFVLAGVLVLCFSSCYTTNQRPLHLVASDSDSLKLSEKKDFKTSFGGNNPPHVLESDVYIDSKIGYSPINHIGIQLHNSYFTTRKSSLKSRIIQSEFSIGFYHKFEQKRKKSRYRKLRKLQRKFGKPYVLFDIYGGYQFGNTLIGDEGYEQYSRLLTVQKPFSKIHFNTYLLKTEVHIKLYRSYISLGFVYGRMDNYKGRLNLGRRQEFEHLVPHYQFISNNRVGSYWMPSIKYLIGNQNLKIYSGFSFLKFSQPWQLSRRTTEDDIPILTQKESMLHFGINIDINGVFKALQKLKE